VIIKNPLTNKYIAINETKNRGWWVPGGRVDPPEDFFTAAIRECKEESGLDVTLKGIIKLNYDFSYGNFARIKLIFYAEPIDCN